MPTRHQKGYIYQKKNRWYVRYYEHVVQKDGTITREQMAKFLNPLRARYVRGPTCSNGPTGLLA